MPALLATAQRVRVYWNSHLRTFSIDDPTTRPRKIMHADEIELIDVRFQVQPAGQRKTVATGRKRVHAYVVGILTDSAESHARGEQETDLGAQVRYNPFAGPFFTRVSDNGPVMAARRVRLVSVGGRPAVYAWGLG